MVLESGLALTLPVIIDDAHKWLLMWPVSESCIGSIFPMSNRENIVWICSQSLENMVDLYSAEGR